ncbi:MAG: hypothetical protein HY578_06815 [Nitrospinae bacterium]|nr:hypothetical protein [Nitrospinota bacterium]
MGGTSDTLSHLMPDMAGESQWKTEGETRCYIGEELFNYMDGGAELYHAYGFKRSCVQDYQKGDNLYTLELYEMESSPKAFGIYSLDRQGEHPPLKQEATYQDGSLTIWKDHYYIRIFIPQKGSHIKEDTLFLGEKAVSRIKGEGEMPYLFKFIPAGAQKDTAISFWQMIPLNNIFFISHENLLNLTGESEGITFLIPGGRENIRIIIIHYPDSSHSRESMEKLVQGYFSQNQNPQSPPLVKGSGHPSSGLIGGLDEYKGKKGDKTVIVKVQNNFLLLSIGVNETEVKNALFESLKTLPHT